MKNKRARLHIDEIDIRLMAELERGPKQTHIELAAKLGLSRETVRTRLQGLLETHTIRIVGMADSIAIGYTTSVIIGINVQSSQLRSVAERLGLLPYVQALVLCVGRFEIIAFCPFRNRHAYLDFLVDDIGSMPGITHVESMLILKDVKLTAPLLSDGPGFFLERTSRTNLRPRDFALLRELQIDARQDSRSLAEKVGVSQSSVVRRTQWLQNQGVMQIMTLINPLALGYRETAFIAMRFDPAKVNTAAKSVASYRNVRTVAICSGRYHILALAISRSISELSEFITGELSRIRGLKELETMVCVDIIKLSHRYELPPDV